MKKFHSSNVLLIVQSAMIAQLKKQRKFRLHVDQQIQNSFVQQIERHLLTKKTPLWLLGDEKQLNIVITHHFIKLKISLFLCDFMAQVAILSACDQWTYISIIWGNFRSQICV